MARARKGKRNRRVATVTRRVLVVDDNQGIRSYLAHLLESRGYEVDSAEDGRSGIALIEGGAAPDVVLLDIMMPGFNGVETLRRIREIDASLPVVMLSVIGDASTIVEAMQLGAADYLNKPLDEEELEITLSTVLERRRHEREQLRSTVGEHVEISMWQSRSMKKIREIIDQVSDTDVTVLIQGESGVGKEVVARAVHEYSSRQGEPFVKVNCAALPGQLLESELYGFEQGAFTGANARRLGRFDLANRGTIFLDEIGEMSTGLQAKLLHVLQDGEYTRLGGTEVVKVDVRVVCATNRTLVEMVEEKTFREDLYFRLNVVNIHIPPLRERRDELPDLVNSFLVRYAGHYAKPQRPLSSRLLKAFEGYDFPGNIRELENMIKRIVVLESEASILAEIDRQRGEQRRGRYALQRLLDDAEETAGEVPLREVGRRVALEAERETIDLALHHTSWNRKKAAKLLNVSYKTLLQKIRVCGLEPS